jgi:hypothetical protein
MDRKVQAIASVVNGEAQAKKAGLERPASVCALEGREEFQRIEIHPTQSSSHNPLGADVMTITGGKI